MSRTDAPDGRRVWCAVSALDVFSASLSRGGGWPTVLRPASVAQRLDAAGSATAGSAAAGSAAAGSAEATASCARTAWPPSAAGERPAQGAGLCDRVMGFADTAPVRAVHWFLGPRGTLIAESAWGSAIAAVLVGWAPHDDGRAQGRHGAAAEVDVAGSHSAERRAPLPGALLLGVFDTAYTARRLAELVPEPAHADLAVVGRWALPDGCPPMRVHSVVHPEPGVLRRELVTQLTEAFERSQEGARQEGAQARAEASTRARVQDPRR